MQGCRSEFSSSCMSTAPATSNEASVMMEKGQVMSRIWRTGAEKKMHLSHSKASC